MIHTQSITNGFNTVVLRGIEPFVILQVPKASDYRLPDSIKPTFVEERASTTLFHLRSLEDLVKAAEGWYELSLDSAALTITHPNHSAIFTDGEQLTSDFIIIDADDELRVYQRKVKRNGASATMLTIVLKNPLPESSSAL